MRINIISAEFLSDVHLRAEYREILMAPHYYIKSSKTRKGIDKKKISKTYILNAGHAYFWYDKFSFIKLREKELEKEMIKRDFKIRSEDKMSPLLKQVPIDDNPYEWSYEEKLINIQRILDKFFVKEFIEKNDSFYKYYGVNKSYQEWCDFFIEKLVIKKSDIVEITNSLKCLYHFNLILK